MGEHLQQLLSSAQAACCFLGGFAPKCSICFIPSAQKRTKIHFSQLCQASRDGAPTRPHCPRTAGGVGDQKGGSVKPPAPANLAAEQSWGQTIWWCKTGGSAYPTGVHSVLDTQGPSLLQTFWGSQLRMCWVKSAGAGHLRCSKFLLAARPGSLLRMRGCGWWHDEGHPGNSCSCLYLVLATLLCSI